MPTSSLPLRVSFSGSHPALRWLLYQFQRRGGQVELLQDAELLSGPYGLSQPFLKILGTSPLNWPLEWCLHQIEGRVMYGMEAEQLVLRDASPYPLHQLDLPRIYREIELLKDTQTDTASEGGQPFSIRWTFESETLDDVWLMEWQIPLSVVPSGMIWESQGTNSCWYMQHGFEGEGVTFVAGEIKADSEAAARKVALKELPPFMLGFQPSDIRRLLHQQPPGLRPCPVFWPRIYLKDRGLHIVSAPPDMSLTGLLREGYLWWLMQQLLTFLNTRHPTPEQVLERLTLLEQKMRTVLTPFLRNHRLF